MKSNSSRVTRQARGVERWDTRLRVRGSEAAAFFAAIGRSDRRGGNRPFDSRLSAACALALCWPAQAQAHNVVKTLGAFWAGVVHPLISIDQLGVLLAFAIWIVWRSRPADAFLVALPAGAFLGAWGAPSGWPFQLLMPVALVFFGAVAATRTHFANVWAERFAAALGGVSIGIASSFGAEDAPRGLFALGVALAVASVTAYALLAARHAAGFPSWIEAGARSGAAVIASVGIGLFAVSVVGWIGF
ncbi:MAG: HupE/UreJ family protein [Methylocystis sp.]